MNEDKPGWKKAELVERVHVKNDPKNNLPIHEAILPNQRKNDVKSLTSAVCVTKEANKTSPLHRKSYSNGILDLDILDSKMSNG